MPPTPPRTTIVPGSEVPLEAILTFARRIYGTHSHQAKEAYYRWSGANPAHPAATAAHAVVAITATGEVVGLVNRIPMTWLVDGKPQVIPGIGDLSVDEEHRKGGLGLRLIMQSTRGSEHAFVNGSNPNSSPLFRGLKYQEITGAFWGRALLAPVSTSWRYGLYRLTRIGPRPPGPVHAMVHGRFAVTTTPDDALLGRIAGYLNLAPAATKLQWTVDTLRWRFFHPLGPHHLLIHSADRDNTPEAVMVLSIGSRRGLRIGRILAHRCDTEKAFGELLGAAKAIGKTGGVDVLAGFTFAPSEARVMRAAGLHGIRNPPATFFFHKRRIEEPLFQDVLVQGAASDLGLEGIPA